MLRSITRFFTSSTQSYKDLAARLRIHAIESTNASNSGHPTSCSSVAEVLSVLFFHPSGMHYHVNDPKNPNNDKLVLSKGHAAPILYAAWAEAGLFPVTDLKNLRKIDSDLEGHPTPRLNFIDIATGSLGQGLSAACGMAYSMKYLENSNSKVFTIMGDAESAEGSVWEAMNFASFYKLDNLVAVFDINRLGQSDPTMFQHDILQYKNRAEAFGWSTVVIDGHNVEEVIEAFGKAREGNGRPTAIIARTFKGRDFEGIENLPNWHGKPLGDKADKVIQGLRKKIVGSDQVRPRAPEGRNSWLNGGVVAQATPSYDKNSQIATRNAYGDGLKALGSDIRIVGLDGDTKNSTMSQGFQQAFPSRFVECFVAEQNMIGAALGFSTRGRIPFISTFAAFFSRGFDQIRLAAISEGNLKFVGSHCGVSIGEDGSSQMGLEDIAMFRTIPGSLVLYPSDAVSAYRAVQLAANHKGVSYIRTSRPTTSILYENEKVFEAKSYVVRKGNNDQLTIVAAGVTLHESLKAANELEKKYGLSVRVIDLFAVKPIDKETILRNAAETGGKILTVEDHYMEGGIFEAVNSALASESVKVWGLYVNELPRSGKPNELLEKYGISANQIALKVKKILDSKGN